MRRPELLIPASSLEVLKTAVVFGADAVYIGGEAFGLRAKAKNFSMEEMREGIRFAHDHEVKVYVTANILAHNDDLEGVREYFKELDSFKTFDSVAGWNRHILDIHIELAIAVFVTAFFEKAPKFLIREIKLKIRRIKINFCVRRKGAEGQEGEYHSQRQKGTDKARSF